MEEKEYVISEIKSLISSTNEVIEINPKLLEYFDLSELYDIKDNLQRKKDEFGKKSQEFLEEVYEKTKEDEI